MRSFDVVVIGSGPAGETAAERIAAHGLAVAIVEDELVGGECVYWACLPSKALLRPYEALAEARRVPGAAEAATGELDVAAVLRRRDEIVYGLDDTVKAAQLGDHGVTLVRGRGRLAGDRRVMAGGELLEARVAVILATGSVPQLPAIDGIEDAWTNREATTAQQIPPRLLIAGGGPVGVEMAQAFQTLGSQVTLVEGEHRLLPREEEFACAQVAAGLAALGVDVRIGQRAERVTRRDGTVTLTTRDGATAEGDVLLVALGRRAATADLGVETVGLLPGETIAVDAHMRAAGTHWLYAIGDINGRSLHTHMGQYQARIAADRILGHENALAHGADGPLSPRVIFTDPQVAGVGHTTETAASAGLAVDVYTTETSGNSGGAYYGRGAPGTAQFLVDRERRILVGCTITGSEVADFLHAATIAIVGEVPVERLRHAVPAFPTRSQIWVSLLEQVTPRRELASGHATNGRAGGVPRTGA